MNPVNRLIPDQYVPVLDHVIGENSFTDSLQHTRDMIVDSFLIPSNSVSPCHFIDSLIFDIESLWLEDLFSHLENLHLPVCTPTYAWEDDV